MSNVLNVTGLDQNKIAPVLSGLNELLASFQVYYTNLRGYHWHVKGPQFYQLHKAFEDMYDGAAEKVDEIAERILQLGAQPENRFSAYLTQSKIKETSFVSDPKVIVPQIVEDYKVLIALERNILEQASEIGDEVTVSLMNDFLSEQEKDAWMLTSYLA